MCRGKASIAGRICVSHPCVLRLETTRTTGKNNLNHRPTRTRCAYACAISSLLLLVPSARAEGAGRPRACRAAPLTLRNRLSPLSDPTLPPSANRSPRPCRSPASPPASARQPHHRPSPAPQRPAPSAPQSSPPNPPQNKAPAQARHGKGVLAALEFPTAPFINNFLYHTALSHLV